MNAFMYTSSLAQASAGSLRILKKNVSGLNVYILTNSK